MSEAPVLIDKREGYSVVTLNRPERLNAISLSLLEAMNAALDDVGIKLDTAVVEEAGEPVPVV